MDKRIKAGIDEGEFHLPESIIQHIQSFLTGKEAAQTTVLSKPWHSAWLSRPHLDFDECDFNPKSSSDDDDDDSQSDSSDVSLQTDYDSDYFSDDEESSEGGLFGEFVEKTIQRYEQSNLEIESLRLRVIRTPNSFSKDMIVRALKIGATRISFQTENRHFTLPLGVFESGNLVELSMEGGKIDMEMDQNVICPKLESLSLSQVRVKCEIMHKILSSCPLIKKLSLSYNKGSRKKDADSMGIPKLHELRCLVLCNVGFGCSFLALLSSKFPSLEDLTLDGCGIVQEVYSRSLKRLTIIAKDGFMDAEFDIPSIQKFTFKGSIFPSLSFESTSREWESHVSIDDDEDFLNTSWFSGLKRILTQLTRSKLHLSLSLYSVKSFHYEPLHLQGSPKHQVETVKMYFSQLPSLSCYALFDGLFRLCRPKFITHSLHPNNTNNDFLCKTLVRGMNGEFSSPSSFMHGLHDLEEANMELKDEEVAAWRPMPLESLLNGSFFGVVYQNVRFQLKWKPKPQPSAFRIYL